MAAIDDIVEITIAAERESTLLEKEEDVPAVAKRIHQALPTFAETTANPEIAYSDHLPQLAHVPLTEAQDGPTLNVLSFNILGRDLSVSGIHTGRGQETDDEITRRYTRIVKGLVLSRDRHNLDCILLQEVERTVIEDILLPILKEQLGENWEFQVSDHGLITCHNKVTLTPIDGAESFNRHNRVLSNSFKHHQTGEVFHLHNSWGIFSPFPRDRENEYRALLAPRIGPNGKMERVVVGGDGNTRYAPAPQIRLEPKETKAHNIVTGAIPMVFHRGKGYPPEQQLGDYPDGGFYTDLQGRIWQMDTMTLDPATGEILLAEENRDNLSWIDEYRMIICLDHSYLTTEIVENKTLSAYEDELKKRTNDPNIQVSMAATSMNDQAVAIRFSSKSKLYPYLKTEMGDYPDVQFSFLESDIEMQGFPVIFVPIEHISALVAAINWVLTKLPLLDQIDAEILRLQTPQTFSFLITPSNFKIDRLNDLKTTIREAKFQPGASLSTIVERWEQTEVEVKDSSSGTIRTKTNGQLLGKHRNILSRAFFEEEATATSQFLVGLKTGPR